MKVGPESADSHISGPFFLKLAKFDHLDIQEGPLLDDNNVNLVLVQ